ncbi:hypothetical protein ON010_g5203 [Phytophthora cinnamomi]|nr:hypothetical protein ON010_g5203 [Phytophthora cinnamomi]
MDVQVVGASCGMPLRNRSPFDLDVVSAASDEPPPDYVPDRFGFPSAEELPNKTIKSALNRAVTSPRPGTESLRKIFVFFRGALNGSNYISGV